MGIESNQPNDGNDTERFREMELATGGMFNEIYKQDDIVAYGKRLQTQINKSPLHTQPARANQAKQWIDERFGDQYERLLFAETNQVVVLRPSENGPNTALSFEHVTISGEIKSAQVITLDKPYIALELHGSSIYYKDATSGEHRSYDSNYPAFVAMCHIVNRELL